MSRCESEKNLNIGQSAAKSRIGKRSETISTESTFRNKWKRGASIYALLDNKSNVKYIGQTVRSLKERLSQHLCDSKRKNYHISYWIRSLDYIPTIKLIKTYPINLATVAEYYWIKYYIALGYKLTNTDIPTKPGMLGLKHSRKTKQKISKTLKGIVRSKETRTKIAEANYKSVIAYKDGIEFKFNSIEEGCKELGTKPSNVSHALKKRRSKAGGYR